MGAWVSLSYTKSLGHAKANGKYICFREREGKDEVLGVFSKDSDNADLNKFNKELDDKKTRHPSVAVAHKMIFSMCGDEWEKSGFNEGDYQSLIRTVMNDYELKTGRKLTWIAAEHRNPDHPHCHVLIKAVYHDKDGVPFRLRFGKEDREFFRNSFQEAKNRLRGFEVEVPKNKYKQFDLTKNNTKRAANDMTKSLLNQLINEIRQAERESERERHKESGGR